MRLSLVRAGEADTEIIWKMQKLAFASMFEKYCDYETSPAAEPLSKTENRLGQPFTFFYFIRVDGVNIGAIRVVDREDGTNKIISPLFVLPEYRHCGFATLAMKEVEKIHGGVGWKLDAVLQEEATCRFYENLGFKQTGERKEVNSRLTLIFYEK